MSRWYRASRSQREASDQDEASSATCKTADAKALLLPGADEVYVLSRDVVVIETSYACRAMGM